MNEKQRQREIDLLVRQSNFESRDHRTTETRTGRFGRSAERAYTQTDSKYGSYSVSRGSTKYTTKKLTSTV